MFHGNLMISQKKLKNRVLYNKKTGVFTTLTSYHKKNIGKILGHTAKDGYTSIEIEGEVYKSHRLAWLYMEGCFPKNQIDHINHNRSDNRWKNLREVTQTENSRNTKKYKHNTSGVSGVHWNKRQHKWYARISTDNKRIFLGSFIEFHEAVNARKLAEVAYGYHENHGKDK